MLLQFFNPYYYVGKNLEKKMEIDILLKKPTNQKCLGKGKKLSFSYICIEINKIYSLVEIYFEPNNKNIVIYR